ncbi:MAG: TetR family transcriptional regulator [Nevskia sp.]|nr:TetR family transcriptional regulator [Nevskia sp.]
MPRKPQQARSKATVESIVEAGFISLSRHGLEGTTTRHIADIAGIGVGSLYEYFDNKEAVYRAMNQHMVDEIVAMIRQSMPVLVRSDIRALVVELLSRFRDLLHRDEDRYLKYASYTMHADHRRQLAPIQKLLTELALQYVMHHPELTRLRNMATMSYIIINGGIFTIIRYLAEPSPSIRFEDLVQGLADMAASYVEVELAKLPAQQGR